MKPLKTLAAICAVAIIALSVVWLTPQGRYVISQMVYSHPSDSEASELTQLRNQLDTTFSIPRSTLDPIKPAMNWQAGSSRGLINTRHRLRIYGVTDIETQAKIIELAATFQKTQMTRPLEIEFSDKENWVTTDEVGSGYRGQELVTRSEVLR